MNYINTIKLDDCFTKDNDLALMNGVQALVRLLIEQAKLDKDNGLITKGYVSGYPGSPLGTLDLELGRAKKHLDKNNIIFIDLDEELDFDIEDDFYDQSHHNDKGAEKIGLFLFSHLKKLF